MVLFYFIFETNFDEESTSCKAPNFNEGDELHVGATL